MNSTSIPVSDIRDAADQAVNQPDVAGDRRSKKSAKSKNQKWSHPLRLIHAGIWAYFLLVIFEGALRKWVLPGLSTPLLVIRDPIALGVILLALRRGLLKPNFFIIGFGLIAMIGVVTALGLGHGSAFVAAYGARPMLVHVPMAFVIGRVLTREQLLNIGRVIVWIVPPMTLLVALQFYSPQSAWVNRGVGGDMEGAGFTGALGFARAPGTFSFTNGLTAFYALAGCWIAYFWLTKAIIKRWLLWLLTACFCMAIPLSISRSLVFQSVIVVAFATVVVARKPHYLGKVLVAVTVIVASVAALSAVPAFSTATEVIAARFENASRSEGGLEGTLIDRFLGGLVGALFSGEDVPVFGFGIGLGTNVGAKFTTGSRGFLIAEGEWGRTIGELGAMLGLSVVFLRVAMGALFAVKSYQKLTRNDPLPWMLLSAGLLTTVMGGWAQPTGLGFYTVTVGLLMAAIRTKNSVSSGRSMTRTEGTAVGKTRSSSRVRRQPS